MHVNRSPVAGVITDAKYRKGKFGNAMGAISAEENEQNVVTVQGDPGVVMFKQIAGLLARRIVFTKKIGDRVARGERVGLIKFGSRTDVIFTAEAEMKVRVGDHVNGGSSVLAVAQPRVSFSLPPKQVQKRQSLETQASGRTWRRSDERADDAAEKRFA